MPHPVIVAPATLAEDVRPEPVAPMPPARRPVEAASATLSVVIPCYNERDTILTLLERVQRVALSKEIIVVDDGSTDGTRELLAALVADLPGITVVFHDRNRGKGAAVQTGLARATGEIVIIQDADLEYDPEDYHAVIAPIQAGTAAVVYGSRNLMPNSYSYRTFYWGGRLVTLVANFLYGVWLTDEATCYKAFARPVIQGIQLTATGFDFCPEVTAKVLRRGYKIREVPIHYHARPREEGKKIKMRDGLWAIWTLVKYRFAPLTAQRPDPASRHEQDAIAEGRA
jgi:glycosyltransferase involved in cell wall biosynthesis